MSNFLTNLILEGLQDADPEEFTPERLQRLAKVIDPIVRGQNAGAYWQLANDAHDFAGGTLFTTEDVAHAMYHPNGDVASGLETPEELASITPEQLIRSQNVLENFLMGDGGYSWVDALRDGLDDVPPPPDEDEDGRCEQCGDSVDDDGQTLCDDCLSIAEAHHNGGHEAWTEPTCPVCRGIA